MKSPLTPHFEDAPSPRRGISAWVGRPVWLEARSPMEIRTLRRHPLWTGEGVPPGEGRPLLIFPGFLASKRSTGALHHVMNAAGWDARVAPVGRNAGPAQHSVDAAEGTLRALIDAHDEPVTIVGHSRGGQFARILAVQYPEHIRQVIAVGTPLTVKYPSYIVVKAPAEALDKAWRKGAFGHVDVEREQWVDDHRYMPFPDSVDLVSVWSRSDGIVDWRLSLEPAARNIEVDASHMGLLNSVAGIKGIAHALETHPD